MSVNGLPRNNHKVKGKHRVVTSITCAKRTKWRVYKLIGLFPLVKDWGYSSHTLLDHTLIPCTLFNLYMVIQMPTLLMMMKEQNLNSIFFFFFNQTSGNMVNPPMGTHSLGGVWNLHHCTRYLH